MVCGQIVKTGQYRQTLPHLKSTIMPQQNPGMLRIQPGNHLGALVPMTI